MRRVIVAAACLAAALPATAAASGDDVVKDCAYDGKLSKRYSQQEYRDALRDIPTDVDEYTDCRDVIRDARLSGASSQHSSSGGSTGGSSGGGGTSGSGAGGASTSGGATDAAPDPTSGAGGLGTDPLAGATEAEKQALAQAIQSPAKGVRVAGQTILPSQLTGSRSGDGEIPGPLLAVLVLLGGGLLGAAGIAARHALAGRRGAGAH